MPLDITDWSWGDPEWLWQSRFELMALGHLLDFFETQLEFAQEELDEYITNELETISEDSKFEFFEQIEGDKNELHSQFPRIAYASWLLWAYAILEKSLERACLHVKTKHNLHISFQDINGDVLNKAKTFISKAAGLSFPSDEGEWEEVNWHRKLRNQIIHNAGEISHNEKPLHQYVSKKGIIDDASGHQIILTKLYCEEALSSTLKLLTSISRHIEG